MINKIEIDGTNDSIWNSDTSRASWNISLLLTIKNDLKIGDSSLIILPTYNVDNIVNFDENFKYTVNLNAIELIRIANKEYYKIEI